MRWRPRQLTRSQPEERRLEADRLLQAGHLSQAAISRQMGVGRAAVSQWAQQLRQSQGNLGGLQKNRIPGRLPRLTPEQWQYLLQVLGRGALQAGFDTDRWTLPPDWRRDSCRIWCRVPCVSMRRELSTVIGLMLFGKMDTRHVEHAIGATDILVALKHFLRHISRPMILIWDRLIAHRAVIVQDDVAAHPDIEVEWLPPYAPDVNPEGGCHDNIKQQLRIAALATTHDIRIRVHRGLARLRQRLDLLLGFFRHAGLSVNQLC
jgi:transposase-like protein